LMERLGRDLPEFGRKQSLVYPIAGLLALIAMAVFSGVTKGYEDLADYAATLSQAQLRALRFRFHRRMGRVRWPTASGSLSDVAVGISPLGHRVCIVLRQSGRMFRRWPTASGWTSNVATGLSPLGHRICIVSRMSESAKRRPHWAALRLLTWGGHGAFPGLCWRAGAELGRRKRNQCSAPETRPKRLQPAERPARYRQHSP
jgi:hypothetical protein